MDLDQLYDKAKNMPSDINEHIETLYNYSKKCETIFELGVRECCSTWAFMKGLRDNGKDTKRLVCVDIEKSDQIEIARAVAEKNNIEFYFYCMNDLDVPLETLDFKADMTFIDTWHTFAQLKRELKKYGNTTRYIIMHDTEIDGLLGESIRMGFDTEKQAKETGFDEKEIRTGLMPAIRAFVDENEDWVKVAEYVNNNGLTVLERY